MTRYGKKAHSEFDYTDKSKNIYLIFGKESIGIPKEILSSHLDRCLRIPTNSNIRALNLSNCVAIISYEILRQQNFINLATSEMIKGDHFLEKEAVKDEEK